MGFVKGLVHFFNHLFDLHLHLIQLLVEITGKPIPKVGYWEQAVTLREIILSPC